MKKKYKYEVDEFSSQGISDREYALIKERNKTGWRLKSVLQVDREVRYYWEKREF
jgi:hypothetical protein